MKKSTVPAGTKDKKTVAKSQDLRVKTKIKAGGQLVGAGGSSDS